MSKTIWCPVCTWEIDVPDLPVMVAPALAEVFSMSPDTFARVQHDQAMQGLSRDVNQHLASHPITEYANALYAAKVELRRLRRHTEMCSMCQGCGQVANDDDHSPWSLWESLTPPADMMVRLGAVRPLECPLCRGRGAVSA